PDRIFPNRPTRLTHLRVSKIHPRLIRILIHRHRPHTRTMLVHQTLSRPFGDVFEVVVIEAGFDPIEVLFNRGSTRRTVRSPSTFHTASSQRYWPQPTAIRQDCIRAYNLELGGCLGWLVGRVTILRGRSGCLAAEALKCERCLECAPFEVL